MIEISKAVQIIDRASPSLESEKVTIAASVHRVLRQHVVADTDLPPFDRSQMDGYALLAADVETAPITLAIVGESAAGKGWHKSMKPGEAVRIMTGAPVPKGADSIQKVEHSRESGAGSKVEILEPTQTGRYIVIRGSEIKKGTTVFNPGEIITENNIATLASFGYSNLSVGKRPRVTILGTGSEIVEIAKKPGRDQIRNSNSVMLDVLSRKFGADTTVIPIVDDNISHLKSAMKRAARSTDILVMTGGVSVGKYDHTKTALAGIRAEIFFEKVRLKPGKPAVFARIGKTLIFALPGNPVSAAVTFHLFVRKAILKMQGAVNTDLKTGFAVVGSDVKAAKERDTYLPSRLETSEAGMLIASPLKWQGSSDFIGFAQADSLIFVPKGQALKVGQVASIAFL